MDLEYNVSIIEALIIVFPFSLHLKNMFTNTAGIGYLGLDILSTNGLLFDYNYNHEFIHYYYSVPSYFDSIFNLYM